LLKYICVRIPTSLSTDKNCSLFTVHELHAWIMWLDTDFFALIESIKLIVVAKTATIDKLFTTLSLIVVVVAVGSSMTPANRTWQIAAIYNQSINQSIKIDFLSNRNITVYTVYASAQKAAREAYAH